MKALSLWQPWASLWLSPRKVHETRDWEMKHRGWLLVHAAKRFEKDHPPEMARLLREEFGPEWFKAIPTGALIGMVNVADCFTSEDMVSGCQPLTPDDYICGNYDIGRFAFRRTELKLFKQPIPYRGRQKIFNVPDELLKGAA